MATAHIKVALIGNPNVGKTSVFNHLTGLNQQVGNYPGITVDKKVGVSKMRFYLQAANPGILFSKTKWMDMDTQTTYSNRGFTLGLHVEF